MADGVEILLLGGPGAAVEDEEDGLRLLAAEGLLHVGLVLAEQLGMQLDVAGLGKTA